MRLPKALQWIRLDMLHFQMNFDLESDDDGDGNSDTNLNVRRVCCVLWLLLLRISECIFGASSRCKIVPIRLFLWSKTCKHSKKPLPVAAFHHPHVSFVIIPGATAEQGQ
jgi:hypothetical protein